MTGDDSDHLLIQATDLCASAQRVYLRLRRAGRPQRTAWISPGELMDILPDHLREVQGNKAVTLELTALEPAAARVGRDRQRVLADRERGLWGFALDTDHPANCIAPNEIITGNRSHRRALQRLCATDRTPLERVWAHPARQALLAHAPGPRWLPLVRQKAPAGQRAANAGGIVTLRRGLADWLHHQAGESAHLPYKYWPGNGRYSPADNTIRRLFGVYAMRQHAAIHGTVAQRTQADRCLWRLFDERYLEADGYGLLVDPNGIKLGAAAVAGMALLAAPLAGGTGPLAALYRTTQRLQRHDGAFDTFWWPSTRGDNQNFYPGETLLFWAQLYRARQDPALRHAIDHSLVYYQRWHRDHRNPAFVPWHTLACTTLYDITGNPAYLSSVVDMNDWLLPMQQWDRAPHDDMRGRFYRPDRPDFGPPHASSTAVYCEGLAAAASALRRVGRSSTAALYARAAQRGLSNLRQLQYLDVTDLFRFSHPSRVRGALRTEVYDLTVRIDSVAHALQACLAWEDAALDGLLPDQRQVPL